MAEHLKLIKEEVEKPIAQVEADWAKSALEKEEAKKNKSPIFSQVLGYTEHKVIINGRYSVIHRVFVKALDSGSYAKLGWVLSNDVKHCMVCSKELVAYLLSWSAHRLHCHACGNIICPECSPAEANVEALDSVGPVPVCNQCYFGQDTVELQLPGALPPPYRVHQLVVAAGLKSGDLLPASPKKGIPLTTGAGAGAGASLNKSRDSVGDSLTTPPEETIPRIWKYGDVRVEKVVPGFAFEARTKDKAGVFVNICTSPKVPFNLSTDGPHKRSAALTRKGQDMMLLIGERGVSATVPGAAVYDVVLHPEVIAQCTADATGVLKEKVCAEVLRSLRRNTNESEFTLFTFSAANANTPGSSAAAIAGAPVGTGTGGAGTAGTAGTGTGVGMVASTAQRNSTLPPQLRGVAGNRTSLPTQPSISAGSYHPRQLSETDRATLQAADETWQGEWRRSHALPKDTTDPYADLDRTEVEIVEDGLRKVFLPMPSISAFFHMEQIAVAWTDLKRPPGVHEKRWAKYKDIVQLTDGTVYIPGNKRAKKIPGRYENIPVPKLLSEVVSDTARDRQGKPLCTYTVWLQAQNGFIVTAKRVANAYLSAAEIKEDVLVHVLYHSFVDDFANSGILNAAHDELDPLLLLNKKSVKVKRPDGTSFRAYHVLVGATYIAGVDDLTGRRILAPERIAKILRRINVVFEESLSTEQYTLSGVDRRPLTDAPQLAAYVYERPLFGSVDPTAAATTKVVDTVPDTVRTDDPGRATGTGPVSMAAGAVNPNAADDRSDAESEVTDRRKKKSPKKKLKKLFLGGWGKSKSTDASTVVTEAPPGTTTASVDTHGEAGHQVPEAEAGAAQGAAVPHHYQHRPLPILISTSPRRAPTTTTPTQVSAGIAGMSMDTDSVHSKGSYVSSVAPSAINQGAGTPVAASAAGAGAGASAAVTANRQSGTHRTSIASVLSDTSDADSYSGTVSTGAGSKVRASVSAAPPAPAAATTPTANQTAASTTHHSVGGPEHLSAAQAALTDPSPLQSGQPHSHRPPSLRAFFTRENSNASAASGRSSARMSSLSQSQSASGDVHDTTSPHSGIVNTQPATPQGRSSGFFRGVSKTFAKQPSTAPAVNTAQGPDTTNPAVDTTTVTAPVVTDATSPTAGNGGFLKGLTKAIAKSSDTQGSAQQPTDAATAVPAKRISNRISKRVKPSSMPGKDLVSPDMLEYQLHLSVNRAVAESILKQSVNDPHVLFGWQIRVSAHMQDEGKGLYVVTAISKPVMGPQEFRLTNLLKEDVWVKLKRGNNDGLVFTPVRKVITVEN